MTKPLPAKPSLENLKKQAKTLLKFHNSGNPSACDTLRYLKRFAKSTDQEILDSDVLLAEVQYAIAMEYGFPSWNALKAEVKEKHDQMRFMHVQIGDSSAESLRRSGVPGKVVVWQDAFLVGAAPIGVSEQEWIVHRARAYLDYYSSEAEAIRSLTDMQHRFDGFGDYEEVVLWFDACMFDQTGLMRHIDWFSRQDMGSTKLSLICIGEFPGMPKFKGLGELRPEQLASLLDTRHEITKAEVDLARRAWAAYRSPDPTAIEDTLAAGTAALSYLGPALRRHLQRYPSIYNGLSRLEQESLEVISQNYNGFIDIFRHVSDMEHRPFFGDTMLLKQLLDLASAAQPLLRVEGAKNTEKARLQEWSMKDVSFYLTDIGREVLSGKADHIKLNGINEWLGGVHMEGSEAAWRWDENEGKLKARPN